MWYQGLLGLSTLQTFIVLAIFLHITIVSVTLYLHRHSAHRSLQLNVVIRHFFRLWVWLTTGMCTKEWTAVHRKHHAKCETNEDPHSPVVLGLSSVFWRGAEFYSEAITEQTLKQYSKGTPDDWLEHWLYSKSSIGASLMLIIDLLLFGIIGLTVWAIQMAWIPLNAAGIINGIGHAWGYRNFNPADASRNIVPWGIIIGGEELHNNHHTYPNSPKLSVKWWEFDIGWFYICLLRTLGLARVEYQKPLAEKIPGKQSIDIDTSWAILNNRFQIMADYSKNVLSPLIKLEKNKANRTTKALLNRTLKLLRLNQEVISEKTMTELCTILKQHPSLEKAYQMQHALIRTWQQGARNSHEMKQALIEWCREAEQSGIQTLDDFARYLRSYSLPGTG